MKLRIHLMGEASKLAVIPVSAWEELQKEKEHAKEVDRIRRAGLEFEWLPKSA